MVLAVADTCAALSGMPWGGLRPLRQNIFQGDFRGGLSLPPSQGELKILTGGLFPETRQGQDRGVRLPARDIQRVDLQQHIAVADTGAVRWTSSDNMGDQIIAGRFIGNENGGGAIVGI